MNGLSRRQVMKLAAMVGAVATGAIVSEVEAQVAGGTGGESPAQRSGGLPSTTSRKRSMRSPRRTVLNDEMIAKHNLSTDPPLPGSLFWIMWDACGQIAQQALDTSFIQGIKSGTLDPTQYGGFNVSDAYYCFEGAQDYLDVLKRANNPILKEYLFKKYESYITYNKTFPSV